MKQIYLWALVALFFFFVFYYFVGISDKNDECRKVGGVLMLSPNGSYGYACAKELKLLR